MPRSSDAFVDAAGVNVHLGYGATVYGTHFATIAARLMSLGVRHIRDGTYPGQRQICSELQQLAAAGIHLDVITTPQLTAAQLTAYAACAASAIELVEGPNEYDQAGHVNWAATLSAYQTVAYAAAKSLGAQPVIGPSLTSEASYRTAGSLAASLDYGNMHDYFAARNPGTPGWGGTDAFGTAGSLAWNIASAAQVSGTKPIMSTETGYSESIDAYAVPAATKARYLMRTLLEGWNAGVARTYIYELADEGAAPFSHYGLLDGSAHAKPAYTALKNLLAHDADRGASPVLTPLAYTLGAAGSVHHALVQRRNGKYVLMLWNEVAEWDPIGGTPIARVAQRVTLTFAAPPRALAATTFDDSGNTTTASLAANATVTLSVGGSPVLVDITR